MGRGILLWMLGVPIPIIILLAITGALAAGYGGGLCGRFSLSMPSHSGGHCLMTDAKATPGRRKGTDKSQGQSRTLSRPVIKQTSLIAQGLRTSLLK